MKNVVADVIGCRYIDMQEDYERWRRTISDGSRVTG
jgi:hypothetical protein